MTDRSVGVPAPPDRRAVVVAGHQGDGDVARSGLQSPEAPVRIAAIGALVRIGNFDEASATPLFADADPTVRRRLAEALPDIEWADRAEHESDMLAMLAAEEDPSVVEMAAWALGEMDPEVTGSLPLLSSTGLEHTDPLCRESAIAALGSLGHPDGAEAVLAALSGDIATVRRRAVLALAAFEGDDVEAALAEALNDRDWQVRQGAEDLLGVTSAASEGEVDATLPRVPGLDGEPRAEEPGLDDPG